MRLQPKQKEALFRSDVRVCSEQTPQLAETLVRLPQTDRLLLWWLQDVRLRSSDTAKKEMIRQEFLQKQALQIQML